MTEVLGPGLPEPNFSYLISLTDETGILQHARHSVPNLALGYTLDDTARALIVALRGLESWAW